MLFSNLLLASVASAAVVGFPLHARQLEDASPEARAHLEARDSSTYHGTMAKKGPYYEAVLEIGSPAQQVSLVFDTGSPLLWVPGRNSTGCQEHKCVDSFDISKSTTWKYNKPGNGWGGVGGWGWDTVSYAGATLEKFNVFVSDTTSLNTFASIGVWGQSPHKDVKGSFVQGLAGAGKISRPIYSINAESYINFNTKATEGVVSNVYYGGFDKKKYQGPLTTVNTSGYGAYGIPISGLLVNGKKIENERDHSVVLDTGGINFDVTNNTLGAIARANGGGWGAKGWEVSCDSKPTLTYEFGYTTIDLDLTVYVTKDSDGKCRWHGLRVVPDDKGTLLTGPPLISRALVIYDNDRSQITVGRARYTSESEVVEITGDIPGALLYSDFVAGKPAPGKAVSSSSSVASKSSAAPKSSSAAPKSSSAAPKTSAAKPSTAPQPSSAKPSTAPKPSSAKPSSAAPKPTSSTLAVKTTSTKAAPEPTPEPQATQSQSIQWCELFGIYC